MVMRNFLSSSFDCYFRMTNSSAHSDSVCSAAYFWQSRVD